MVKRREIMTQQQDKDLKKSTNSMIKTKSPLKFSEGGKKLTVRRVVSPKEQQQPAFQLKKSAAPSVVFSESQGEEIIDDELLSVRDLSDAEFKVVLSKFIKMCDTCNTVKPPRTHHCSQCKRCVIRMDHHCVWIANCVGLHNMKPFLLFLIYSVITSVYSFGICVIEFFRCEVFD